VSDIDDEVARQVTIRILHEVGGMTPEWAEHVTKALMGYLIITVRKEETT
jgi:hypothetical protein